MWVLAGFLILLSALALFWWDLRHGVFRRIPVPQYVLMSVAVGVGLGAFWRDPGVPSGALLVIEAVSLGVLVWYVHFEAPFPRKAFALDVGDRFPPFRLRDSDNNPVTSDSLQGRTSNLYLFFRGDW